MTKPKSKEVALSPAKAEAFEQLADISPGQWWRYVGEDVDTTGEKGIRGYEPNVVYLVTDVKYLDGDIHNVSLEGHPRFGGGGRMVTRLFLEFFERAFGGEKERDAEISELMGEIEDLRQEIQKGPPAIPNLTAGLRLPPPNSDAGMSSMVQNIDRLDHMQERAKKQVALAEASSKWIAERTKSMGELTRTLGEFYKERAGAALASVKRVTDYADHLNQGVKTLGLYTGEDVRVTAIRTGESAPESEPLTLMQSMLYVDEETAVHYVDQGGFDHTKFESFFHMLAKDDALVERIFPTRRCVVMMRPRRKDREYFDFSGMKAFQQISAIMQQLDKQKQDKRAFLMIRDGDNIYEVYSELSTDAAKRLFPTRKEMEAPFQKRNYNWKTHKDEYEEITRDDVSYTDSLEKHDELRVAYRRLCILLWGLNDRLGLLGKFYPADDRRGFLDLEFQATYFKFIYDDDESRTLGHGRPDFKEWWRERNSGLRIGSRVLCYWKRLITPDTARVCFVEYPRLEQRYRWEQTMKPKNRYDVRTVVPYYDHMCVRVEVFGERRGRRWGEEKTTTAAVKLDATRVEYGGETVSAMEGMGFLVLDDVRVEDVKFYLNSRYERREYLEFIPVFAAALEVLEAEIEAQRPLREFVRRHLEEGKIAQGDEADMVAIEAIRQWKAANKGKDVPDQEPARKRALAAIVDHCYRIIKGSHGSADAARELAISEGRTPIRLTASGSGKLILYAEPIESERVTVFGHHAWAQRITLEPAKGRLVAGKRSWVRLGVKPFSDEILIHSWDDKNPLIGANPPIKFERAVQIEEGIIETVRELMSLLDGDAETFGKLLEEALQMSRTMSKGKVHTPDLVLPIGVATVRKQEQVVYLTEKYDRFLMAIGDQAQRDDVLKRVLKSYAQPEHHRVELMAAARLGPAVIQYKALTRNVSLGLHLTPRLIEPSNLKDWGVVPDGEGFIGRRLEWEELSNLDWAYRPHGLLSRLEKLLVKEDEEPGCASRRQ